MTKSARRVLEEALDLGVSERAELIVELLRSLEGEAEEDAEAAWAAEIEQRLRRIESGEENLASWDEVRAQIENDLARR